MIWGVYFREFDLDKHVKKEQPFWSTGSMLAKKSSATLSAVFILLIPFGCSTYDLYAPNGFSPWQLESVSESERHGRLVIRRNSDKIYIDVNNHAAFRTVIGNEAVFRLKPGEHAIKVKYWYVRGSASMTTTAQTPTVEWSIDLNAGEKKELRIDLEKDLQENVLQVYIDNKRVVFTR